MTVVTDASATVAALIDNGPDGRWADATLSGETLVAPYHLLVEAANALRRAELANRISAEIAALAHADLGELRVRLFPYRPFADRIWDLRHAVTSYDAWYVALAEFLDIPIVTLDRRLADAHGPRCRFYLPP